MIRQNSCSMTRWRSWPSRKWLSKSPWGRRVPGYKSSNRSLKQTAKYVSRHRTMNMPTRFSTATGVTRVFIRSVMVSPKSRLKKSWRWISSTVTFALTLYQWNLRQNGNRLLTTCKTHPNPHNGRCPKPNPRNLAASYAVSQTSLWNWSPITFFMWLACSCSILVTFLINCSIGRWLGNQAQGWLSAWLGFDRCHGKLDELWDLWLLSQIHWHEVQMLWVLMPKMVSSNLCISQWDLFQPGKEFQEA